MGRPDLNLLIGGEAGQGLVTIAMILTKALVRSGYFIVVTQSYQSRIRGGHNTFAIRISPAEIIASRAQVDLLVALNAETVQLHRADMSSASLILVDERFATANDQVLKVPFQEFASDRSVNVAYLGILTQLLGLDNGVVFQALEDYFGAKKPEVTAVNQEVFNKAVRWAEEKQLPQTVRLAPATDRGERLMLNGNEAIALGAISAGVKFCAFYPMTPSTSIPLTLQAAADTMGLVVEQAEDEIAAINMALGASYAGAPALVATSGGGFALMVEGVSLAGMTETPVFIVVAQRPGPATGLPTRTEQGDLEFVLHAGHGEFPRAIFAPGSVEECFHLSRQALLLAERYQTPIFLLTDQFLADSYRAVAPFEISSLEPVAVGADPAAVPVPYHRYALTDSGISPRLLPGLSEQLVVCDSDEHTPDGHITEDLTVRVQMVEKRLRKEAGLRQEVIPPAYVGHVSPDLLLVTWGSNRGAVLEAVATLRAQGRQVAALCFSQVWPLVGKQFLEQLQSAKEVIMVEGNATGQMARLIRQETGFAIKKQIRRYDGLPITPEYILQALSA
ncbi:MAG: 2-oxoacid:acceptor oxidoreductase subunit alpha [Desulfobacca sp.]|uniref:2-oxoacid:acceptor oxidoreductase subunit alpha n=1 Tax=Desulfobacca sp. TaxID=2067990 RepID=UPI00404B4FBF